MPDDPRSTINFAAVGTTVIVTADTLLAGGLPAARSYIGIVVAWILALLLAGAAPQVAAGLMLLMFVAVLLSRGGRVLRRLT